MSITIKSLTLLAVVLVAVSQTSAQELLWDGSGSPETVGYVAGTNSTTTTLRTFLANPVGGRF